MLSAEEMNTFVTKAILQLKGEQLFLEALMIKAIRGPTTLIKDLNPSALKDNLVKLSLW